MKKKVNMFGKSIPLFVIVVLGIALVGAALVPYLSGLVVGTVIVESPLELISGGTFTILAADAFNPISQDFTLVNHANTEIPVVVETNITAMDDSTKVDFSGENNPPLFGEEFEYFLIGLEKPRDDNGNGNVKDVSCSALSSNGYAGSNELSTYNLDLGGDNDYCYWNAKTDEHWTGIEDGIYYVQMGDTDDTDGGIPPLGTMYGRMKLQFKINVAPATYTFETQAFVPSEAKDLY